jgi:hypothetical protein
VSDIVPRNQLAGQGARGVIAIAGGIGALVLAGMTSWTGIIVGGLLAVIGLVLSGPKKERIGGIVIAVAGAAVLVGSIGIPLISRFADWVMRAAGIVLIGVGGYSLVKFISGLRKRT